MRASKIRLRILAAILVAGAIPLAAAQQPSSMDELIDRIVAQEQWQTQSLAYYAPVVETYTQNFRSDLAQRLVPVSDQYFLGRAVLTDGARFVPLSMSSKSPTPSGPSDSLRMLYVDPAGFDRTHYRFDYVRREFLGDVRCMVFDVTPLQATEGSHFLGRIWVEDREDHIVRFSGAYTGSPKQASLSHFDSWRVNAAPHLWVPAMIYSEQGQNHAAAGKISLRKTRTRFWGYNSNPLVHAANADSEATMIGYLEAAGLLAPRGDADPMLEIIAATLEDGQTLNAELHCRVLMTSTLDAFSVGHTIVISRGLLEALPDQASLAAVLALQMAQISISQQHNAPVASLKNASLNSKDPFAHFGPALTAGQERVADSRALALLEKSPYASQLGPSLLFFHGLAGDSKKLQSLISPRIALAARATESLTLAGPSAHSSADTFSAGALAPVQNHIQVDPWTDRLEMADISDTDSLGNTAPQENASLALSAPDLQLTRAKSSQPDMSSGAVSAQSDQDAADPADPFQK